MSSFPETPHQRFERVISAPEKHINLALAAVLIAAEENPDVDIVRSMGRIALLRRRVRRKLKRYRTAYDVLHAVNEVMFEEERFSGNRRNYYDPRNSLLPEVLERRLGMPITLSIIYLELAAAGGRELASIGLPGHFVLRAGRGESRIYVDPFDRGGLLSRAECLQLVKANSKGGESPERYLRPMGKRAVLQRLLTNLKIAYMRLKDLPRALRAAERIQLVEPEAWHNLGDMARIHSNMGNFVAATDTLLQYLENAPAGEDISRARTALDRLRDRFGDSDSSSG